MNTSEKMRYFAKKVFSEIMVSVVPIREAKKDGDGSIQEIFNNLAKGDFGSFIKKYECVLLLDSTENKITFGYDTTVHLCIPIQKEQSVSHIRRWFMRKGFPTAYDGKDEKYIRFLLCSVSLNSPVRIKRFPAR